MAGMECPNCHNLTFFPTATGRECTRCHFTMTTSPNGGKGGKGQFCCNCKKYQVFNGKCRNCGTTYG